MTRAHIQDPLRSATDGAHVADPRVQVLVSRKEDLSCRGKMAANSWNC